MALIDVYPLIPADGVGQKTGIALALYSGNDAYLMEIQRAPSVNGDPDESEAEIVSAVEGDAKTWIDFIPLHPDDHWHYRIRHNVEHCDPSDWSEWTAAYQAIVLPDELPDRNPLDWVRVTYDPSQFERNGSRFGRVDVTVKDPALRVSDVEYQLRRGGELDFSGPDGPESWYDEWTDVDGGLGVDRVVEFQQEVPLSSLSSAAIKWRVTYVDVDGQEVTETNAWAFDVDTIPHVTFSLGIFGTTAVMSWDGDEDTRSIQYIVFTNPTDGDGPTAAELSEDGTCVNGRENDGLTVATTLAAGDRVFVRARGWSMPDCSGTSSLTDWTFRVTYPEATTRRPVVTPTYSQTVTDGVGTGTTSLSVIDTQNTVTRIGFADKIGKADWGGFSWDEEADFDTTHNTALAEKHNSSVQWRVEYDTGGVDSDGAIIHAVADSHTFDVDRIPDVQFNYGITADRMYLSWVGDEDTGSVRYTVSTTAMPTEEDLDNGFVLSGRRSDGRSIASGLAPRDNLFVRARGYSESNGTGTHGESWSVRLTYPVGQRIPIVTPRYTHEASVGRCVLTIIDPLATLTGVSFATKSGDDDVSPFSTPDEDAEEITVALSGKHNSIIFWRVFYRLPELPESSSDSVLEGMGTFDIDNIPEIINVSLDLTPSRQARAEIRGDDDVTNATGQFTILEAPPTREVTANTDSSDGYGRNATEIDVDGFSETVTQSEIANATFSISGVTGRYVVQSIPTISSGTWTFTFSPGLAAAVGDNREVMFELPTEASAPTVETETAVVGDDQAHTFTSTATVGVGQSYTFSVWPSDADGNIIEGTRMLTETYYGVHATQSDIPDDDSYSRVATSAVSKSGTEWTGTMAGGVQLTAEGTTNTADVAGVHVTTSTTPPSETYPDGTLWLRVST